MQARVFCRRVTAFGGILVAVVACSQSVPDTTGPAAARVAAPSSIFNVANAPAPITTPDPGSSLAPGLVGCLANHATVSATQVVGPEGGTIWFGKNSLVIPAGALDSNVTITAMAPAGPHIVAHLAPHGLQFNTDVQLSLDYSECNWTNTTALQVEYLNDALTKVLEIEPTMTLLDDYTVVATIRHFSMYGVGRRSVYAAAE